MSIVTSNVSRIARWERGTPLNRHMYSNFGFGSIKQERGTQGSQALQVTMILSSTKRRNPLLLKLSVHHWNRLVHIIANFYFVGPEHTFCECGKLDLVNWIIVGI